MPRRTFPWFVMSMGLVITLFALLQPVFGQAPGVTAADDSALFPTVELRPVQGEIVKGKLRLSVVTIETDTGSRTIRMQHVKQITIHTDTEGVPHDTVQLVDKTRVEGRIVHDVFEIEIAGAAQPLQVKKTEVRDIRVLRETPMSLVAILLGLLALTAMEIVLGVDNIIFLAIIASKLPKEQQPKARRIGLIAALGTRLGLLGSLFILMELTSPLFTLPTFGVITDIEAREVSIRDLVLLVGGLFLIGKSTFEIHEKIDHARQEHSGEPTAPMKAASFGWTIVTIAVIDIVFSLDSVITAIGMVEQLWVMITAVIIAMIVMLAFAGPIANFVDRHPTIKILALSFLILIGVMLVAEGLGQHIDKGYIYVAMAFSLVVEVVNMRLRGPKKEPASPVTDTV